MITALQSSLSNLSYFSMSFVFFGIAVTATALFVYNLRMYLEIRRSSIMNKKDDRFQQTERFSVQRVSKLTTLSTKASTHVEELTKMDDRVLPHGWERGITVDGFIYYIDHNTQTTSWEPPALVDPPSPTSTSSKSSRKQNISDKSKRKRKSDKPEKSDKDKKPPMPRSFSTGDFSKKKPSTPSITITPVPLRCQSENDLKAMDRPLPAGWEEAFTPEGLAYYINHNDATTTWIDPRTQRSQKGTQTQVLALQSQQQVEEEEKEKFLHVVKTHSREDSGGFMSRSGSDEDLSVLQSRLESLIA